MAKRTPSPLVFFQQPSNGLSCHCLGSLGLEGALFSPFCLDVGLNLLTPQFRLFIALRERNQRYFTWRRAYLQLERLGNGVRVPGFVSQPHMKCALLPLSMFIILRPKFWPTDPNLCSSSFRWANSFNSRYLPVYYVLWRHLQILKST